MAVWQSTISQLSVPSDQESIRPVAPCFSSPDDAPRWEMCDFRTAMGSYYIDIYRSGVMLIINIQQRTDCCQYTVITTQTHMLSHGIYHSFIKIYPTFFHASITMYVNAHLQFTKLSILALYQAHSHSCIPSLAV